MDLPRMRGFPGEGTAAPGIGRTFHVSMEIPRPLVSAPGRQDFVCGSLPHLQPCLTHSSCSIKYSLNKQVHEQSANRADRSSAVKMTLKAAGRTEHPRDFEWQPEVLDRVLQTAGSQHGCRKIPPVLPNCPRRPGVGQVCRCQTLDSAMATATHMVALQARPGALPTSPCEVCVPARLLLAIPPCDGAARGSRKQTAARCVTGD